MLPHLFASSSIHHTKKAPCIGAFLCGAQKRTRTSTPLTGLAPETSASTNFAIWAICFYKIHEAPTIVKLFFFKKNAKSTLILSKNVLDYKKLIFKQGATMTQNYVFPTQADLDKVDLSWGRYLCPSLHPEGWKIMIAAVIIITALDFLRIGIVHLFNMSIPTLWWIGVPFLVFAFYFFRNPDRVTPTGENLIIAPADGIVSNIKPVVPPKELGLGDEPMTRISIFMSVFNVHVNRSPVSGVVDKLNYRPGKFISVAEKDSEDNERQEISIIADNGVKIGVVQIAGLVARRIYCPLKTGQKLKAGEIFGMIRFGSRLDVFLPEGVYPKVMLGQVAVAGETILADMNDISHKTQKEQPKGKK